MSLTDRLKAIVEKIKVSGVVNMYMYTPEQVKYLVEREEEEHRKKLLEKLGGTNDGRSNNELPSMLLSAEQLSDISAKLYAGIRKSTKKCGRLKRRKSKGKASS